MTVHLGKRRTLGCVSLFAFVKGAIRASRRCTRGLCLDGTGLRFV